MDKTEAINKAIDRIKGRELPAGTVAASREDKFTWELVRYDGDDAVCELNGKERRFPRSEIFDVNKITNIANHYLNLGFWEEGMESVIIGI